MPGGPGKGNHTVYSDNIASADSGGTNKDKIEFLRKLYSTGPEMTRAAVIERAKSFLEKGEKSPIGIVDDRYAQAPNLSDVTWKKAGDPSTPYTPDIRAPGMAVSVEELGSTDSTSVKTGFILSSDAPDVKGEDLIKILAPNLIPGAPGTATRSPHETSPKVNRGTTVDENYPTDDKSTELYK